MRHAYQLASRYGPTPAAVVDIILAWNGRQRTVPALVDTGASGTVIRLEDYTSLRLLKIGEKKRLAEWATQGGFRLSLTSRSRGSTFRAFPSLR